MPLNLMDAHFRSFARNVVPRLLQEQIGVLGMKPLGSGALLHSNTVTPIQCLHYALNLPTSTVITGVDTMPILDQAFEAVRSFKPLAEAELSALLARTAEAATSGRYEAFKTTSNFDATAHNPQWPG